MFLGLFAISMLSVCMYAVSVATIVLDLSGQVFAKLIRLRLLRCCFVYMFCVTWLFGTRLFRRLVRCVVDRTPSSFDWFQPVPHQVLTALSKAMGFHWNNPDKPATTSGHRTEQTRLSNAVHTSVDRNVALYNSIAFSPGRLFNPLSFATESGLIPPPPPPPPVISLAIPPARVGRGSFNHAEGPPAVRHQRLIPPHTRFARAVVMGNATSRTERENAGHVTSNLTVQMNQGESQIPLPPRDTSPVSDGSNDSSNIIDEADSASGPSPAQLAQSLPAPGAVGRKSHRRPPPASVYRQSPLSVEHQTEGVSAITLDAQPFRKNRR